MTHTIKIYSVNKFGETEWEQRIEAETKRGAVRMANNVIRSCGLDPKAANVDKLAIGKHYETWTLGR
jgi:hypothetical protein